MAAAGLRRSMSGLRVSIVHLIQGPDPTSLPSCINRHDYPQHTLSNGNGRKPNRDGDVFHCDGVHPATVFSGTDLELLEERNSQPSSQYRLSDEGANDKHDEGVK